MGKIRVGAATVAVLAGELDLSEWTMEELERGQRKGANGRWSGARPKVIPTVIYDEFIRRKMSAASELLRENTYDAIAELVKIAKDPSAENRDKLKAIEMILNRTMGKEPVNVKVDMHVMAPWERAMEGLVLDIKNAIETGETEPNWDDDEPPKASPFMIGPNAGAEG